MQFFLMIAAALLSSGYSAPTSQSEDYSDEFGISDPLQNVTKIELPVEDKKILCDFLATFRIIKIQLFEAVFMVNMDFMKNVENKFQKDFKEYQEKHPNSNNKSQIEEFFGVGVSPLKIYRENSVYRQKFYKDIGKVYQGINEHFLRESQKIKGTFSQKTAETEYGFFEKFKGFEEPSKKYYNDKSDLINSIEREFKYRYQCLRK